MMTATVNRVIGRKYVIGSRVYCSECPCGYLTSAVVDPATGRLEHLIVTPDHGIDSRLVPIAAAHCEGEAVRLHCSLDDFNAMEPAVDVHITPMDPARPPRHVPAGGELGLAVLRPRAQRPGPGPGRPRAGAACRASPTTTTSRPARRASTPATTSTPATARSATCAAWWWPREGDTVTHILVDEGLLRGHKRVAIPMEQVGGVGADGVRVLMTRREVKELGPCEVVA